MAALVPLLHSHGRRTCYYNRLHNFSATIPRCHNNVYVNSFLPRKTKTLKFSDCRVFPLTYDLNGLNSRIKRHFFFGLFLNGFAISFYSSFSYNFMPRSGYSALHGAKKEKKTSAEVSSSETITFHKTNSSSLLDLTTTTWNNWINLLLLWIPNWIEKVKFKIQLVLEIKLTHYLSSLGACPGEPYHTQLKWPTLLVATMDVSSRTKIQRSLKNLYSVQLWDIAV